jgi:hypothetical protein
MHDQHAPLAGLKVVHAYLDVCSPVAAAELHLRVDSAYTICRRPGDTAPGMRRRRRRRIVGHLPTDQTAGDNKDYSGSCGEEGPLRGKSTMPD